MSQGPHQLLSPRPENRSFFRWTDRLPTGTSSIPHQIIEYEPHSGHEGDVLRVTLFLGDMSLLSHLSIAIGSCVAPTTTGPAVIDRAFAKSLDVVELTAPVPTAEWTEEEDHQRVPLYVVICDHGQQQQQQQQVMLGYWFVGHFAFESATTMMTPRRYPHASPETIPSLLGSTGSEISQALASLHVGAKHTRTGGDSHYYLATCGDGGKTDPEHMSQPSGIPEEHGTGSAVVKEEEAAATMAGRSAPIRHDAQNPATATKIMAHPSFHSTPLEDDQSEYLNPTIITTSSAAASYNSAVATMGIYPSRNNNNSGFHIGTEEHQQALAIASSTFAHSYVTTGPGALQAATTTNLSGFGTIAPTASIPREEGEQLLPRSAYTTLNYDDYNRLPYKADLRFESDLNLMTRNWTLFELQQQRRLVRFWRLQQQQQQQQQQDNNGILCSFAPVRQDEQLDQATMTVVSCIYWHEAEDYFITSVDCIHLLENLLGVHFTAEEKNRVRRNFEAFRPQTISRLRPQSAAFFRLVMDFPPPKPRTIEKDLKVFPWSCLESALRKIVGRYQPSYSSTAGVNLAGMAATSYVIEPS